MGLDVSPMSILVYLSTWAAMSADVMAARPASWPQASQTPPTSQSQPAGRRQTRYIDCV